MAPIVAVKTLAAINAALERDQGATFRRLLREVVAEDVQLGGDAFRDEDEGFRSHLGASLIGRECERQLWYTFRWATKSRFEGRIVRLFNRGHLEEPRFIALLRMIGCEVWRYDDQHRQFRVKAFGGHYGGSLDCVVRGIPDLPPGVPILGEFKTHNERSFNKVHDDGVREAKPEHYVQMQNYMGGYQLAQALYLAVNKNDDDIYAELVPFDPEAFAKFYIRAGRIITAERPPRKISNTPGWHQCKFCDQRGVCHLNQEAERNCRTCIYSRALEDGSWACKFHNVTLSKKDQLAACPNYRWIPM